MLARRRFVGCALCAGLGLIAADASAQAEGLRRTILQRTEFPGDKYVTILVSAEIDPGFLVARHTHPGVESTLLVDGGGTLSVQGQPDRVVKPGEGWEIPPEAPHSLRNGDRLSRLASTYVVEKDKPLATLAPE